MANKRPSTSKKSSSRISSVQSDETGHVTPADGNIFLDLGFSPKEAEKLKRDSDKKIARLKARSGS